MTEATHSHSTSRTAPVLAALEIAGSDDLQHTVASATAAPGTARAGAALVADVAQVVEWLFLIILAVLPLDVYLTPPGQQAGIFLSEVLILETCVIGGLLILYAWWKGHPLPFSIRWRDALPLGGVVVASVLATLAASHRGVAARDAGKYLVLLAIFLLARAVRGRTLIRSKAVSVIVLAIGAVVVVGLLGTVPGMPDVAGRILNIQRLPSYLPATRQLRASSTFRFADELEAYLLLVLPLLVTYAARVTTTVERVMYAFLAAAGCWLLTLTYARSSYLVVAVVGLLLLFLLGGKYARMLGPLVLAAGAAAVFLADPHLATRAISLVAGQGNAYGTRLSIWRWAWDGFLHRPILGLGPRNLQYFPGAPWADAYRGRLETNAENSYLNALVDMGIVGGIAVAFCIYMALRHTWRAVRRDAGWLDVTWSIGVFAGLIAILLDALFHPTWYSVQVSATLCAMIGLVPDVRRPHASGTALEVAAPEASGHPSDSQPGIHEVSAALDQLLTSAPTRQSPLASRVVFLINSPGVGGAQLHSLNLAAELQRLGVRVLAVCPPGATTLAARAAQLGVPSCVRDMGMSVGRGRGLLGTLVYLLPRSRRQFYALVRTLANEDPTIFVAPFLREQLLLSALKRTGPLRIVWTLHSPLHYLPHRLVLKRVQQRMARYANAIVALSQLQGSEWLHAGLAPERLYVIPNAIADPTDRIEIIDIIDIADLTDRPDDRTDASLATPNDQDAQAAAAAPRIGFVSRLSRGKGAQYLIAALPRILAKHPSARVLIAGTGSYEPQLKRLVRNLHLQRHVEFLGYVEDVPSLLRTLTAFVLPTVDAGEVLPTVVLEASGAGVPVVASWVAGIPEAVQGGTTGLLVRPGNVDDLVEALVSLLDEPEWATSMGRAGRQLIGSQFALSSTGQRVLAMLQVVEHETLGVQRAESTTADLMRRVRSRLIGNTSLLLVSKVLTAAATMVWTVLAARSLQQTIYGDLMTGMGMLDIAASIADAGLTSVTTRTAAQAEPDELPALTGTLVYLRVALGIVSAMVAVGVTAVLPFTADTRALMLVLAPSLAFASLTSLSLLFRARSSLGQVVLVSSVASVASMGASTLTVMAGGNAFAFAYVRLGATALTGCLMLGLVIIHFRPSVSLHLRLAWQLSRAAAPYGVAVILVYLYYRIDVPLLALLSSSKEVAVYTSAYRILDVITLLPTSASSIALAEMARLAKARNRRRLALFSQQYLEIAFAVGLLLVVVLTGTGAEILRILYRGRYDSSLPTLEVLAWAGAATLITNVFLPLINALERHRTLLLATLLGLVANVGCNVVLIPRFGAVGAAAATLLTELIVTTCYALVACLWLAWRPGLRIIGAACAATAGALALQYYLGTHGTPFWLAVPLALLAWLLVFGVLARGRIKEMVRSRGGQRPVERRRNVLS